MATATIAPAPDLVSTPWDRERRIQALPRLLRERILVLDGAMGTMIQQRHLTAADFGGPALEGCNEHLVLTRPDLVARMHSEYFAAGVDAVETATFGAFPLVLSEYQVADKTFAINERAASIASLNLFEPFALVRSPTARYASSWWNGTCE